MTAYLYIPYLSRYTNQQQPLLLQVRTVVNDLTAGQARVTVKHFQWLRVTYNTEGTRRGRDKLLSAAVKRCT